MEIFFKVLASIFGFNLKPTFTFFFFFIAILFITFISSSDSALISNIFLSMAKLISSLVLPTPEKTILFGLIPALRALNNSPFETTSAPRPNFLIILKIYKLLFDFTEKHINGSILLKFFLKLLILVFNLLKE